MAPYVCQSLETSLSHDCRAQFSRRSDKESKFQNKANISNKECVESYVIYPVLTKLSKGVNVHQKQKMEYTVTLTVVFCIWSPNFTAFT